VTVEYLDLADYVAIAAEVTGLDAVTVMKVANLDLADSALHAPAAGFGETEFYPEFVEINGWLWSERPSVDEAEGVVLAIAAGEWDEDRTAEWLTEHLEHEPAP
jgi:death on curing protein